MRIIIISRGANPCHSDSIHVSSPQSRKCCSCSYAKVYFSITAKDPAMAEPDLSYGIVVSDQNRNDHYLKP